MGLDFQMVWWPDGLCEALVARGFAVARFDNRDAGLSTHFASGKKESPWRALMGGSKPAYTTLDMLDDALAVMDALGWPSAHVMGGSMGAGLAQALAVYHPDRVRSVISCMGLPADSSPLKLLGYIKFGKFLEFRRLKQDGSRESQIELLVSLRDIASPGFPFPEQWARETAAISHDPAVRPHVHAAPAAAGRAQKIRPISGITAPTLVISGQDDPLIKPKGGRDTAARIPGARFVTYPGMGHNLPEELWPRIIDEICAVTGVAALSPSFSGIRCPADKITTCRTSSSAAPSRPTRASCRASTPAWRTSPGCTTTGSAARTISRSTGQVGEKVLRDPPGDGLVGPRRTARSWPARCATWPRREGIRQFLDIGTGLPSANNTHEVAAGRRARRRGWCTSTTTRSCSPTPAPC